MLYLRHPPHPALRGAVRFYWELRSEGGAPELVVPDGRAELVLNLADPFEQLAPGAIRQPRLLLVGELRRPVITRPLGSIDLLGVSIVPGALSLLCDAPADAVADRMLDEAALAPSLARAVRRVRDADPADRVPILERALLARLPSLASAALAIALAGRIERARGRVRVEDLAAGAGVTPRHVERVFRRHVGIPARTLAALARFQAALSALEAGDLAGVAAASGHADQAHLVRAFRRFAGVTPGQYLRGEHGLSDLFTSDPYNRGGARPV